MYRLAIKCIVLGLLLWCLVPTSVWLTNWINDTYANSYSISAEVLGENEEMLEDDGTNSDEDPEQGAIYSEKEGFSISNMFSKFFDKVSEVAQEAREEVSEKTSQFEDALNAMIEGVAVLIVTTCVIPILVMFAFVWVLKIVTGLNLPTPSVRFLPKASKIIGKIKENSVDKIDE